MTMTPTEFADHMTDVERQFEHAPLSEATRACYGLLVDGTRKMFSTQTNPWGAPWPVRVDSFGHPILNKSGALQDAATGGSGSVTRIGGRSVEYGVQKASEGSLAGAAVHQYGATIRAKKAPFLVFRLAPSGPLIRKKQVTIPARPYLGATDETQEKCGQVIAAEGRKVFFQGH